ncbi:MAG: M23 family metallopeptidase [Pontibacterium sp.]
MKNRLVITFTTVRGSKQFSLNQVARFLLVGFFVVAIFSFFVSNPLLFFASGSIETLEESNHQLVAGYTHFADEQMRSQQAFEQQAHFFEREMAELVQQVDGLSRERSALLEENLRIGEDNASLNEANLDMGESLASLEQMLAVPSAIDDDAVDRAEALRMVAQQRLFFLNVIPNGKPVEGIRISDKYGYRTHPVHKKRIFHRGIDFTAKRGTPVYATADGIVEFSGHHEASGFGNLIILQHALGFKTYYGHLDKVNVKTRRWVARGELIGWTGNTGISTGPHLHYEVRYLFSSLNPEPFVRWNITNFDSLFNDVKDVPWASLTKMYPLNQVSEALVLAPLSSPKETPLLAK